MSDEATRQHYKLATGKGLDSVSSGKKSTFAKGGHVSGGNRKSNSSRSGHKPSKK